MRRNSTYPPSGFSTLEILIALFVLTTTLVAVALTAYALPFMLTNTYLQQSAHQLSEHAANQAEASFLHGVDFSSASTTQAGITTSLTNESLPDNSVARIVSVASWTDVHSQERVLSSERLVATSSNSQSCDPVPTSRWEKQVLSEAIPITLPAASTTTGASIYKGIEILFAPDVIVAAARETTNAFDYTLTINDQYFDNASTSKTGYQDIFREGSLLFVANGFGSASTQTCNDSVSCAQVHIFDISNDQTERIATYQFSKDTEPFAFTSAGLTAPAAAVYYDEGYLYVGLQKTARGFEFNILDVHNPYEPVWVGGAQIGRSVNDIVVRGTTAFVATDDSENELSVFDISTPSAPMRMGGWNAPGGKGFGLATNVVVFSTMALVGRTYVNNASELALLDLHDPVQPVVLDDVDLGTYLSPQSVKDIVMQDSLAHVLTTTALHTFSVRDRVLEHTATSNLPSSYKGHSLSCKGSTLYVLAEDDAGAVVLQATSV